MLQAEQGNPDWDFLALQAGAVLDVGLSVAECCSKLPSSYISLLHGVTTQEQDTALRSQRSHFLQPFPGTPHRQQELPTAVIKPDNMPPSGERWI